MDIKTFKNLAPKLPASIAVLMRGPTGVGKSHLAYATAAELNLDLIDVRGSTMDESKVTGIPDFEVSKDLGVATFVLPSWFVRACREPVVLFLDELNRSMPQVQQAFFQVVLDRSLGNDADGNPMTLHPETRVYAAVNHGAEYDVNDMDPALLRRFWTVDLEPTNEDWISWAKDKCDSVLVDFIRQNPAHLRADVGSVEPGTVMPTRRPGTGLMSLCPTWVGLLAKLLALDPTASTPWHRDLSVPRQQLPSPSSLPSTRSRSAQRTS